MLNKYLHLNDEIFLSKLDALNIRTQYVAIDLLSFDEKIIKRHIEGSITAGSLTVNGSSAVRRTISLTMLVRDDNSNITNLNNEISLNKIVNIQVGYKNLIPGYEHYGDIIWFPCGRYLITSASVTRNTNNWNISIQGKDKMVRLDGTVGGILPASVTFHEVELEDGTVENPTIFEIIKNAVHQYGMEDYNNIIINDLDMEGRNLIQYVGPSNIYFETNFKGMVFKEKTELDNGNSLIYLDTVEDNKPIVFENSNLESQINSLKTLQEQKVAIEKLYADGKITCDDYEDAMRTLTEQDYFPYKTIYGTNVGYEDTLLTYPGELILNAGDTVVTLLTKLNEALGGNYEFFYDLEGRFVFQEKRNYLNTASPLNNITAENYFENYTTTKCKYYFNDLKQISSFGINPKYENIKNDFIVWGERTTAAGAVRPIRYHLVIDEKPEDLSLASQWMWAVYNIADTYRENVIRYEFSSSGTCNGAPVIESDLYNLIEEIEYDDEGNQKTVLLRDYCLPKVNGNENWFLIAKESKQWREELYRRALINNTTSFQSTGYDIELLSEWRKLYDTLNISWKHTDYFNPDVIYNPGAIDYWLDFIDENSNVGAYSINQIGKRTKVENKGNAIKTIYNREPLEDINFIQHKDKQKIEQYLQENKKYFMLSEEDATYFSISSSGLSAFDQMRSLLQNHLIYNIAVSITCTPRYYFEPNQLIYINDGEDNDYNGTYFMTQFTLPLTYNGNMTITANQLAKRI